MESEPLFRSHSFDREHRDFLSRISAYVFVLYWLLPLVAGLVGPAATGIAEEPFEALLPRTSFLVATGGASFLAAFLPALALPQPGIPRRVYEFLLFPVAVVCLVAQWIMYAEFGTEINDRLLGLFEGNFTALWAFARDKYAIDLAIGGALAVSIGLFLWLRSCRRTLWRPTAPIVLAIGFVGGSSAAIALGLGHDLKHVDSYDPGKVSGAPLYQALTFATEQAFLDRASGVRDILERTAEVRRESNREEIADRLGEEPESFLRKTIARPAWMKRRPSHVFLFVIESMDHAFLSRPALASVAPRLRRFAREGVSVPHFYSTSGSTLDAVEASVSGVAAQLRYPDARVLERMKIDSLPRLMERAGYRPIFYAASHGRFGNKEAICEAHGYDRFVGMPDRFPERAANEWGVHDGPFFEWTRTKLGSLRAPRFVTFLNVSYHSPYNVPEHELRGDSDLPKEAVASFYGATREERRSYARHAHYADREIGEMVDWLVERHPDALFCFLSDHCGLRLRNASLPRLPFILWGDEVIDSSVDPSGWFGSHMDVPATLANLVLPEGATLRTLGEPCWSQGEDRISLAAGFLLCRSGYWSDDGQKRLAAFGQADRRKSAGPLPRRMLLEASAIESLSWGLTHDRVGFLALREAESPTATLSARID